MGNGGYKFSRPGKTVHGVLIAALVLTLSACAGRLPEVEPGAVPDIAKQPPAAGASDPWEAMNRATFWFNLRVDDFLLRPAAIGYRYVLPNVVQKSVHNILDNASSPVTFANDMLQGEFKRGGVTFGRLLANSTAGIGGIFDVAGHFGLNKHKSDFGQTLALWGTGNGPYLMLPLLGPSTVRDGLGRAVDVFLDPLTYVYFIHDVEYGSAIQRTLEAVDFRARNLEHLDELRSASVDYYAAVRSAYRQTRRQTIYGAGTADNSFDDDGAFDDLE